MLDHCAAIEQLAGTSIPEDLDQFVEAWMLPDEPIRAALYGNQITNQSFLVLTDTVILHLCIGPSECKVEHVTALNELTGYQTSPGWTGAKLRLNTIDGDLVIGGTNPDSAVSFIRAVERAVAEMAGTGVPFNMRKVNSEFDEFVECITTLFQLRALSDAFQSDPTRAAAEEIALNLALAVEEPSENDGYVIWLLLSVFADLLGARAYTRRDSAIELLRQAQESNVERPLLTVASVVAGASRLDEEAWEREDGPGGRPDWCAALSACASALESIAHMSVPQDVRAALLDRAAEYRELRRALLPPRVLPHPLDDGPAESPDATANALRGLERLAALRESGAINEEEFAGLKRQLLMPG